MSERESVCMRERERETVRQRERERESGNNRRVEGHGGVGAAFVVTSYLYNLKCQ